jgi:hypothetical protein
MWELIASALSSLFGGGGASDAAGLAAEGGALGGGAPQLSGAGLGAAGAGLDLSSLGGLGSLGGLAGLGLQGAQLGMGFAGGGGGGGQAQMPQFDQPPANLAGQQNPGALRQRALGSSADLQARGLNVGAAPDFIQTQLESELGLTPDEFQRIFRLGGGATDGAGA